LSPRPLGSPFSGIPARRQPAPGLKALEELARLLRLQLQPIGAQTAGELEGAFSTMARGGTQAVLVFATPPFITARQRLAQRVGHCAPAADNVPRKALRGGRRSDELQLRIPLHPDHSFRLILIAHSG